MSYLKMALRALESTTDERVDREAQTAGIANHVSDHTFVETPQDSPLERILTCFDCGHFRLAVNSPNPTQAFGLCEKRNRGRYGCATACEAALTDHNEFTLI